MRIQAYKVSSVNALFLGEVFVEVSSLVDDSLAAKGSLGAGDVASLVKIFSSGAQVSYRIVI